LAASAWAWRRGTLNQSLWPVLAFVSFLLALQIVGLLMPANPDPVGLGATAIASYLVATALAALVERRGERA